jgi:hypothetical protein
MPALDDFYSLAAAAVCLAVLGILALVLFTTLSPSQHGYTRLATDAESPSPPTLDDDNDDNEVQGYAFELRKARGIPIDTQEFERHRLLVHISIAVLAVVGLALDAAAIVQLVLLSDEIPSSLYLASASAGLHTVQVLLSMLDLGLAEAIRLTYISLLAFVWLLVWLLVALSEYRLRLPIHAADAGQLLFTLNVLCGTIGLVVAFISPTGPKVMVDATQNLTARQILRNTVGGGSVAQNAWGFKATSPCCGRDSSCTTTSVRSAPISRPRCRPSSQRSSPGSGCARKRPRLRLVLTTQRMQRRVKRKRARRRQVRRRK